MKWMDEPYGDGNFRRTVEIAPAYDKRNSDPSKNYGIHGCDMRFLLGGEKGVVQFVLFTNWHLPNVTKEFVHKPVKDSIDLECRFLPMPADLGFHSPTPMYEGQNICQDKCDYLDGKPCYYDGSGLNAIGIYNVLLEKGSDGIWKELEEYYYKVFEPGDEGE